MANTNSRSINTVRNTIIGVISQCIVLVFTFVSRTFFIKFLGAEYLGINSLYTNILSVLSLAELGIGNVMIYSLYKPVLERNNNRIASLLNYYKLVYRKIAISILIIGFGIIPILDKIINSQLDYNDLVLYYILFLLDSVFSYFIMYKTSLINANQKNYIIKSINTVTLIVKNITQIIVLLITGSYILYLILQITFTIINNLIINKKANLMYKSILSIKNVEASKTDKKVISDNVKSIFIYKIGVVTMNSTDSILISAILGTVYVGYYSNYWMLITMITTFIGILIQSVISSIGNLNADGDMEKSYALFRSLLFFFHWISAFCSICFLLVFNDFIIIWIGREFLLGNDFVIALVMNFYLQNIINPVWMYRETMGLFNEIKHIMIIASIINIILSITLGPIFGVAGIILATVFARILTTVWFEPKLLYAKKFLKPISNYWCTQLKYFLLTIISAVVSVFVTFRFPASLPFILLKIIIVFLATIIIFIATNKNTVEFITFKKYFIYLSLRLKSIKKL